MTATYQVAQILQGQQKFDEAIAAWQGYLAKFPNGPQSADAQRAILDTKLLIAGEALRREKYADARAAWSAFVAQNPLDARVPQILFQVGESFVTEEKYDDAIAAWETLISKFPGSEPAAHGQFLIASIYENQKGEPGRGDRAVQEGGGRARGSRHAAQRIAVMESRELTVVTPRTFRSGETPHLKVTTRNLENLTFSAYRLNAEAYFRKKQLLDERRVARHRPRRRRRRVDGPRPEVREVQAGRDDLRPQGEDPGRLGREGHGREAPPGDDAGRRLRPRRDRQVVARPVARLRPGHEDRQGPRRRPGCSSPTARASSSRRRRATTASC